MVLVAGARMSARQATDQQFADLAGPPVRLVALGADDEGLELGWELVGVADRPARAVGEGTGALLAVAGEQLVAGFAGDAELPTDIRHALPVEEAGDEAEAFFHDRTHFPRHPHLPPKGEKCYPCVRNEMSPMSRAAQYKSVRYIDRSCGQSPINLHVPICQKLPA